MGVRTLLRFLIGDRQAILEIAADRRALWVGLLFVVSAAFARDYDREDLWREPWHLLLPVAASLMASSALFLLTFGKLISSREPARPPAFTAYLSFLTLFWMTAPLAWLYAIPYERFLSAAGATAANLWTLGLVAVWRVILMIRIVSVLMGYTVLQSVLVVTAFADVAALLAIVLMPKPVIAVMGGVDLTESEQLILALTFKVACFGILLIPVSLIGTLVVLGTATPEWGGLASNSSGPNRGLWALAGASVAVWFLILPWTQAENRLRADVESNLRTGRISDGLLIMSAHSPADFPPHWDPPPRLGYGETAPDLWDVLDVVVEQSHADWVRLVYVDKLKHTLRERYHLYGMNGVSGAQVVRVLRRLPEGPDLVAAYRDTLRSALTLDDKMAPEVASELKALLGQPPDQGPRP
jgi:hypothetical protein